MGGASETLKMEGESGCRPSESWRMSVNVKCVCVFVCLRKRVCNIANTIMVATMIATAAANIVIVIATTITP